MKKIILIILLGLITNVVFSQRTTSIFKIPTVTTPFGSVKAAGTIVFDEQTQTFYQLQEKATATSTISTLDILGISGLTQWTDVINGISYLSGNVNINDSLSLKGIKIHGHNDLLYDDVNLKIRIENDTIRLAENISSTTYIYALRSDFVLDSNQYDGGGIYLAPYWYTAKNYENVDEYVGGNFQFENYNNVNNFQHSLKNTTVNRANDGDSIYIKKSISYNGSMLTFGIDGGVVNIPEIIIGNFKLGGGGGGTLYSENATGLLVDMSNNIANKNVTNAYGMHLFGNLEADNKYGIYEDFGDNYFTNKVTVADTLEVGGGIIGSSIKVSGEEALKIYTYIHTVTDISNTYANVIITAVTLADIRNLDAVILDAGSSVKKHTIVLISIMWT